MLQIDLPDICRLYVAVSGSASTLPTTYSVTPFFSKVLGLSASSLIDVLGFLDNGEKVLALERAEIKIVIVVDAGKDALIGPGMLLKRH